MKPDKAPFLPIMCNFYPKFLPIMCKIISNQFTMREMEIDADFRSKISEFCYLDSRILKAPLPR